MEYLIAPFFGWLIAGIVKFVVNYIKFGKMAYQKVGNGGFPSNHTTILVTTIILIGFKQGFSSPIFGLGVAVTFIVIIDAIGLRNHVGKHAKTINDLISFGQITAKKFKELRESMGHNIFEVLGGVILGCFLGYILSLI